MGPEDEVKKDEDKKVHDTKVKLTIGFRQQHMTFWKK